jgi:site-specific recombinase XerD
MLVGVSVLIPMNLKTPLSPSKEVHPLVQNKTLQLAAWKVSGDPIKQWDYQSVKNLLLGSWKRGASYAYNSAWQKWHSWCLKREVDPFSGPLAFVLDFLAWMHFKGYEYRTIHVHRSAISSVLPYIDGLPIGQLPLVKQLLRGILQKNPPFPRYQYTWDIDIVLKYLLKLPANKDLDLKTLGKKLAILLALASRKRVSEISRLDSRFMATTNDSIVFHLPGLSKTQKGCSSRTIKYCKFGTKKICVVACILEYEKRTSTVRPCTTSEPDPLLRVTKKTFKGLSSQTVANWITCIMSEAGLDVMAFKAHSYRMASTSKAALLGVNIQEILDMGD